MRSVRAAKVTVAAVALCALMALPAGAARLSSVRLPAGLAPVSITATTNTVVVANTLSSTLTIIDPAKAKVIGTMHTSAAPLVTFADGPNLWVGFTDGAVVRFSSATRRILTVTRGFTTPVAITAAGNRLWVADKAASTVTILNRNSGAFVGKFDSGGTGPVALAVAGNRLIVANSDSKVLTALSLRSAEPVGQLTVSDHISAIAAAGTRIWYTLPSQNLVGVMESTDMTRRGTHPTAGLQQDGLLVYGTKVYVANGASSLVVQIREGSGSIIRGHRTGATPKAMCVAAGRLWVTNFNGRSVSGIPL